MGEIESYPLERLADPLENRRKPEIPLPPKWPLTEADLYERKENGKEVPKIGLMR